MLIGTSKYNYYHINFLDGFTWLTTGSYQAVKSSHCTQQEPNGTISFIGHQLASGCPEISWQPTTLSSSTFYGQNIQFNIPEAGAISEDRWPSHLQTQHPLQDTKNSWKMTWSARRGIHMWATFKSRVAQTCRQQTKHSKCFILP